MFERVWLIGWSVCVLPLAVLLLRGWAPSWARRPSNPAVLRVRGVALLLLWCSGILHPLLRVTGAFAEDGAMLTTVGQGCLMLLAFGLIGGAELTGLFGRREGARSAARNGEGG